VMTLFSDTSFCSNIFSLWGVLLISKLLVNVYDLSYRVEQYFSTK